MHLLPLGLCWSEWLAFGATFGKNSFLGSLENRPTVVFFLKNHYVVQVRHLGVAVAKKGR